MHSEIWLLTNINHLHHFFLHPIEGNSILKIKFFVWIILKLILFLKWQTVQEK